MINVHCNYNVTVAYIAHYNKFQNFYNDFLIKNIKIPFLKLSNQQHIPFKTPKESMTITFNKHEPLAKRHVRADQSL